MKEKLLSISAAGQSEIDGDTITAYGISIPSENLSPDETGHISDSLSPHKNYNLKKSKFR